MHRRLISTLVLTTALAVSCVASTPGPEPEAPPPPARTPAVAAGRSVSVPVTALIDAPAVERSAGVLEVAEGEATYYAAKFDGRRTASGIVFRNSEPWAAHRSYPFGTRLRVTNLRNGRSAVVTVVDRGPFGNQRTIIDLSSSIAKELDFIRAGRIPVRIEVLEWGTSRK